MEVKSIGNPICHLAECPIWNDTENALYWTDILEGRIWRYMPEMDSVEIAWQGDMMVGGFALTANNDMVLCANKGVFYLKRRDGNGCGQSLVRLYDIPMTTDERFNDITTDSKGRIFAGTLSKSGRPGTLYRLENGKKPVVVLEGIGCSNGMTFSLDLKYFYHTDSRPKTISRFDYDLESGSICNRHVIYTGAEENGVPDGITIDNEGCIWVACWQGGKVLRIDPDGAIMQEIRIPAWQVSSVVFGTSRMNSLFITSACEHGTDLQRGLDDHGRFLGGTVYHLELPVTGRKEWPADFDPTIKQG